MISLRKTVVYISHCFIYSFFPCRCYAKLGMKGGPQPVSLQTDKCLSIGTIQHELLHIVGFRHEQNRPDRNNYIEVIYSNIPESK